MSIQKIIANTSTFKLCRMVDSYSLFPAAEVVAAREELNRRMETEHGKAVAATYQRLANAA